MDEEGVSGEVGGYCGRGGGGGKCGRWNPTPEQVKVLTELFRSGLRTPSTEQIQRISSHLSSFGKIESKNVFYWFQNHKARERHHHHHSNTTKKRRRAPPPEAGKRDAPAAAVAARNTSTGAFASYAERERDMQTLELFPLSTYEEPVRIARSGERKDGPPAFSTGWDPPLDLRLSYF